MKDGYGWLFIILGAVIIAYFVITGPAADWLSPNENISITDSHSESLQGIDNIVVKSGSTNAHIVQENRSDLKVDLKGKTNRVDLQLYRNGSEIVIELKRKRFTWFNFFNFGIGTELILSIPQEYNKNLEIGLSSGNVSLIGTESVPFELQQLQVSITSGNANLKNIEADHLVYNGTSGNFTANRVVVQTSEYKITSGNVKITDFQGEVKGKLTSGNFSIELDKLTGPIEAELTSGRAVVDVPDDANFTLDARVTSGDIDIDLPLQDVKMENKRNIKGTYGSGEHPINLKTTSGNIILK